MSSYIPLGVCTSYSLLQSTIRTSELQEIPFSSIGIADKHNLFGAMDYNDALISKGIKPITGCELTLNSKYSILVYCKNEIGYKNLCRIISNSYTPKEASVFLSDFENVEGLMAIAIPGQTCEVDQIEACSEQMEKYFSGNWAVGIRNRENDEYHACAMSAFQKTPIVAVPEIKYIKRDYAEAYQAITCIKHGKYLDSSSYEDEFHLPTSEEMEKQYQDWKTPLENTFLFAEKCSFLLKKKKPQLPSFTNDNEHEYLKNKTYEGLKKKITDMSDENHEIYTKRLEFELNTINTMGFDGYFLIVADFINWAKEHNIAVGPGRGSGAGSLVAYCIGITDIDPLKFGLVFERFLNPGRVSMPDFDVDFCPKGRAKVINYISERYGKDQVANIITFGSLQSKGVLRDVGRVLQVPYPVVDRYSKAIPVIQGANLSLEKFMENNAELENEMSSNPQVKKMFELSLKLEGLHRHASIHAAGVVIGKEALYNMLPLYKDNNLTITQFSLNYIEDAGLVKFDLLGLTALTIISDTVKIVQKSNPNFNIENIILDDKKTLDVFRNGQTVGIFQFESKGMTQVVVDLQPETFVDLIAVISLYRPGPMENIPTFIKRKHGLIKTNYLFPEMEQTLNYTYGVLVYQEQVLEIARNLAGYSMQEADLLRRAIGKKKPAEMKKLKIEFVSRICERMNAEESKATELFEQIESFARYAFVKAHATPYALIGYQTAYLKANYPIEFLTSSMILEQNNTDKLAEFVYEAKRMEINILLPDINKSNLNFEIEGESIRFGLSAIKNVGVNCIEDIIAKRPFHTIEDFFQRTNVNKKSLEHLIKSGSFDSIEQNRALVWEKRSQDHSIPTLFQIEFHAEEWSDEQKATYEYEAFGMYITSHPLNDFPITKFNMEWVSQKKSEEGAMQGIGKLEKVISKKSPNGDPYSICVISDPFGIWRCISKDKADTLESSTNKMIWVSGEDKSKFIIANNLTTLETKLFSTYQIIFKINNNEELSQLHNAIRKYIKKGNTQIMLTFENDNPLMIGNVEFSTKFLNIIENFSWSIR